LIEKIIPLLGCDISSKLSVVKLYYFARIPLLEVLIEKTRLYYFARVPLLEVLVKILRVGEHVAHAGHLVRVPILEVLVKALRACKNKLHIRHIRHIPIPNLAVEAGGKNFFCGIFFADFF
jgi:hypothetical protein